MGHAHHLVKFSPSISKRDLCISVRSRAGKTISAAAEDVRAGSNDKGLAVALQNCIDQLDHNLMDILCKYSDEPSNQAAVEIKDDTISDPLWDRRFKPAGDCW